MNINDPAAVKALLDQLGASRAWHDALGSGESSGRSTTLPSPSVASLLSQLGTSPDSDPSHPPPSTHRTPRPATSPVQDVRSLSFQQALPHLTQLAADPEFLAVVSRLRKEQNELEQQLWEERKAIHDKHEEKAKVARTKASLIGAGLSKHEADAINDAYRRDLQKFDKERVLAAWDALVQKQQTTLESLRVPTMFATTSQTDCQKQQRVIQVLEGLER